MAKFAVMVVGVLVSAGSVWTAATQVRPASAPTPSPIEDVLLAVRTDLQSDRAETVKKNVTLSGAEAEKFWPMFEAYQKEQSALMDAQLRGIQRYIETFDTVDDAGALALINAHLDRDEKMTALRRKWLAEFRKVLTTEHAVRVMQIDRRLSLTQQLSFVSKIPLAH